MAQQGNTEPRGTGTPDQQRADTTKGATVDPQQKSLAEAREDSEQPAGEFETHHDTGSAPRPAKA